MPKRYPPLTPKEVKAIVAALGFVYDRNHGDHEEWKRAPHGDRTVTIDTGEREFDDYLLKSMIRQAGVTREDFYRATPATARKIGRK